MSKDSLAKDRDARLMSDFFDNAAVGLHWQDEEGIVLRANAALLDLLGLSESDLVGHPISRFYVNPAVATAIQARLARGETVHSEEALLRCKDGRTRSVLVSANVLWDARGFVHARCFTRDISRQSAALDALEQTNRRYAAILEGSLDAIVTMDGHGRLADFNPAAERPSATRGKP